MRIAPMLVKVGASISPLQPGGSTAATRAISSGCLMLSPTDCSVKYRTNKWGVLSWLACLSRVLSTASRSFT